MRWIKKYILLFPSPSWRFLTNFYWNPTYHDKLGMSLFGRDLSHFRGIAAPFVRINNTVWMDSRLWTGLVVQAVTAEEGSLGSKMMMIFFLILVRAVDGPLPMNCPRVMPFWFVPWYSACFNTKWSLNPSLANTLSPSIWQMRARVSQRVEVRRSSLDHFRSTQGTPLPDKEPFEALSFHVFLKEHITHEAKSAPERGKLRVELSCSGNKRRRTEGNTRACLSVFAR